VFPLIKSFGKRLETQATSSRSSSNLALNTTLKIKATRKKKQLKSVQQK